MSTINYPTNYTLDGQSINHASIHPSSSLTSPPGTTISNHNQSPVNLQSINSLNNNNLSNIPPSPISLASSSSLSSASLSSISSITPTPTPTTTFNFFSIDDNDLPDLPQHTAQLPPHSLPSSSSSLIIQHQPHHFYQQPYQYHPQQIISPAPSSPLSSIFDYRDYSSSSTADEIDMPEFLQYNREKYENSRSGTNRRRRRPSNNNNSINNGIGANNNIINNNNSYNGINTSNNNGFNHNHNNNNIANTQHFQQQQLQLNDNQFDNSSMDEVYEMIDDNNNSIASSNDNSINNSRQGSVNSLNDDSNNFTSLSHAEFRRQIHIQSEQKRRAEIKDGFDELRKQLPITYANRKMSKALLLQKAVAHMKNMQRKENFLLDEINRLSQRCIYMNAELENEKRMNYLYRQKHNLNKLYQIGL
nr:5568_t:CDS:2 [Entrophospora candida]